MHQKALRMSNWKNEKSVCENQKKRQNRNQYKRMKKT